MQLTVFTYKPCWPQPGGGHATDGGFPMQIEALAELFDRVTIWMPLRSGPPPAGLRRLDGGRIEVAPLPEPRGRGVFRKLGLLLWLPRWGARLWRAAGRAEAIHALVPGDLGTLGLLLALARRKPLLVRHCGTWGNRATLADRFLAWLLPRIAGGRNVVLATGGDASPPAGSGGRAAWIFSTSLSRRRLEGLRPAAAWDGHGPLRLVTVGRLTAGKNASAAVAALGEIRRRRSGATLDVVGHGPAAEALRRQARELGLEEAVTFHGNLPHQRVLEVLCASHLFVFPTRVAEGFPKAVVEAMACGLPVLAPPVSVLPRLLEGGGGWELEDTGSEAVATAVLAVSADPEELARRGAAARRSAQRFTLEAWREEIRRHLEAAWGGAWQAPPAGEETAGTGPAATQGDSAGCRETAGTGPAATQVSPATATRERPSAVKAGLRRAATGMGLPAVVRRALARKGAFVLELHGVAGRRYPEVPAALQPSFTAEDLERTLAWVGKRFAFLTPEEALRPGARGVLLTFDDGFANNVTRALPLLERFAAPAVFFVAVQHVEEPGDWLPPVRRSLEGVAQDWPAEIGRDLFDGMGREHLEASAAHPLITIGCHTLSHPRLTGCSDDALQREVVGSRDRLRELTGGAVELFAYPYGDYDRRVAEAVRNAGYRAAFVEDSRGLGLDDFEVPRVGLYRSDPAYLALKLSGLHRRPWRGPVDRRRSRG